MFDPISYDLADKTKKKLEAHLDDYATLVDSLFIEEGAEWEEDN